MRAVVALTSTTIKGVKSNRLIKANLVGILSPLIKRTPGARKDGVKEGRAIGVGVGLGRVDCVLSLGMNPALQVCVACPS